MIAVLAMVLLFVVVIGALLGSELSDGITALVSMTVGGVITAYFGKRDTNDERMSDDTITETETTIKTSTDNN